MTEFDETGLPMMDVARGDENASRRVRGNLELLRDNSGDPEFRRLVQEVLDGRRSLREATHVPAFAAGMTPHIDRFNEKWEEVMGEDQEVLDDEQVERFKSLQAEVKSKMDEITRKVEELQRLQNDLQTGG
ncbi:hypothetical protein [Actinomadura rubrisoli]|uniref:Uncharacterized protein n=1 Tax=Actinomadura rubrisoli TaxID=2530368 RepID=A0A4R5ACD3_9ACTN|nr:hypothetical protein [Actinomadura rubrisoli]TDD68699.1 hypothetical protein E1298_38155 [Actinomadura rubrisoli]